MPTRRYVDRKVGKGEAFVDFKEFLYRQMQSHLSGRRWGKAIFTLAATLLVGVTGTGVTLGVNAYDAHEARIVAVEKEETIQRQNQCHEVFGYVEDDTPNKQIDPQSQAKINQAIANAVAACANSTASTATKVGSSPSADNRIKQ